MRSELDAVKLAVERPARRAEAHTKARKKQGAALAGALFAGALVAPGVLQSDASSVSKAAQIALHAGIGAGSFAAAAAGDNEANGLPSRLVRASAIALGTAALAERAALRVPTGRFGSVSAQQRGYRFGGRDARSASYCARADAHELRARSRSERSATLHTERASELRRRSTRRNERQHRKIVVA
jgi:hypothetical protein